MIRYLATTLWTPFWASPSNTLYDEILRSNNWGRQRERPAIQPELPADVPIEEPRITPQEPLPIPTDVPVKEPMDIPLRDPRDVPPPKPEKPPGPAKD